MHSSRVLVTVYATTSHGVSPMKTRLAPVYESVWNPEPPIYTLVPPATLPYRGLTQWTATRGEKAPNGCGWFLQQTQHTELLRMAAADDRENSSNHHEQSTASHDVSCKPSYYK